MLIGLYIVIWFTLSGTEAGIRTLQIGAQQNSTFLTRTFIALGANPTDVDPEGRSALHFAGYLGADQVIPVLVEKGTPVNLPDTEGRTALHLAAYAGQTSAVAALMDQKADPEIKETVGEMTALHLAVVPKTQRDGSNASGKGSESQSRGEKRIHTIVHRAEREPGRYRGYSRKT